MTDPAADRQAIRQLTEDWLAAVRAKDIDRLTAMVAEDAVFLPAALPPVRGKQAVAALYRQFFPQFRRVEQTVSIEEIEIAGDWAFSWGFETFVVQPHDGGPEIRRQGKAISILRRQPDGSWLFARGINNTAPENLSAPKP